MRSIVSFASNVRGPAVAPAGPVPSLRGQEVRDRSPFFLDPQLVTEAVSDARFLRVGEEPLPGCPLPIRMLVELGRRHALVPQRQLDQLARHADRLLAVAPRCRRLLRDLLRWGLLCRRL